MTNENVEFAWADAEALWLVWNPADDELLARAAFERTLHKVLELDEEGLYFRPGGWTVDVPAVVARLACAAAVLAAGFQLAGLEDLDREIIIAAAGFVSAINVKPVRLNGDEKYLLSRLQSRGLDGQPLAPEDARKALPKHVRRQVTPGEISDALDRLVAAGLADETSPGVYAVRSPGSEAWIRIALA